MIGRDLHQPWPPGSPSISPAPSPYLTFFTLIGPTVGFTTQTFFRDHPSSGWGFSMSKGTDIGPLIPHFGVPSILMPIELIFSSSKSHFGASRYQGFDNKRAQNCVAVALFVFVNPNLNCGTPLSLPLGAVIALNTHCAMMSWGDLLGGLCTMGLEIALSRLASALGSLGGKLAGALARRMGYRYLTTKAAKRLIEKVGRGELARRMGTSRAYEAVKNELLRRSRPGYRLIDPIGTAAAAVLLGSPTGIDAGTFGGPTAYGAVANYLDPPVEGDPQAPPPPPTYGDLIG